MHARRERLLDHPGVRAHRLLVGAVHRQGEDHRRRAMAAGGRPAVDQAPHEREQRRRRERMMLQIDRQVIRPGRGLGHPAVVGQLLDAGAIDGLPGREQLDRAVDSRHATPPLARSVPTLPPSLARPRGHRALPARSSRISQGTNHHPRAIVEDVLRSGDQVELPSPLRGSPMAGLLIVLCMVVGAPAPLVAAGLGDAEARYSRATWPAPPAWPARWRAPRASRSPPGRPWSRPSTSAPMQISRRWSSGGAVPRRRSMRRSERRRRPAPAGDRARATGQPGDGRRACQRLRQAGQGADRPGARPRPGRSVGARAPRHMASAHRAARRRRARGESVRCAPEDRRRAVRPGDREAARGVRAGIRLRAPIVGTRSRPVRGHGGADARRDQAGAPGDAADRLVQARRRGCSPSSRRTGRSDLIKAVQLRAASK